MRIFGNGGIRFEVEGLPHIGEHARINTVSLGTQATRLSEAARLQQIDLHQRQMCPERPLERAVIHPCSLINHAGGNGIANFDPEPFVQLAKARFAVGNILMRPVAQPVGVKFIFENINTNAIVLLLRCPMLVMQSLWAAAYLFRPHAKTMRDQTLKRSLMISISTIRTSPGRKANKHPGASSHETDKNHKTSIFGPHDIPLKNPFPRPTQSEGRHHPFIFLQILTSHQRKQEPSPIVFSMGRGQNLQIHDALDFPAAKGLIFIIELDREK